MTFKEFLEASKGAFGTGQNYSDPFSANAKNIGGNTPYLPTSSVATERNSLMSVRRRQLLDDEDPSQRYHYYITLIRNLVADVDTGKLLAKKKDDKYFVVYTKNTMTALRYPPEEQEKLSKLNIFKWGKGYGYKSLLHYFHHDFDKIENFRKGLMNPNINNDIKTISGYYIDEEVLIETRDKMNKNLLVQGGFERAGQYFTQNIGNSFLQGALVNRLRATPTTSSR